MSAALGPTMKVTRTLLISNPWSKHLNPPLSSRQLQDHTTVSLISGIDWWVGGGESTGQSNQPDLVSSLVQGLWSEKAAICFRISSSWCCSPTAKCLVLSWPVLYCHDSWGFWSLLLSRLVLAVLDIPVNTETTEPFRETEALKKWPEERF